MPDAVKATFKRILDIVMTLTLLMLLGCALQNKKPSSTPSIPSKEDAK